MPLELDRSVTQLVTILHAFINSEIDRYAYLAAARVAIGTISALKASCSSRLKDLRPDAERVSPLAAGHSLGAVHR